MRQKTINRYVYETIVFIKELPYDLERANYEESKAIKKAILDKFETIPQRYRRHVFRTLDLKSMHYDSIGHDLWHPHIRQIRNSGRGPLFQ